MNSPPPNTQDTNSETVNTLTSIFPDPALEDWKNGISCPLCYDPFYKCVILDCKNAHQYCLDCITNRLKLREEEVESSQLYQYCPECRNFFKDLQTNYRMNSMVQDFLKHFPHFCLTENELRERNKPIKVKFKYANGDLFLGFWVNGKKHGHGEIISNTKEEFTGIFVNDEMLQGRMKYPNGTIYGGGWKDGKWEGIGTLKYYQKGVRLTFKGFFSNGKKHGPGKIKVHDDKSPIISIEARFINGKQEDKAKIIYRDGSYYEGNLKEGSFLRNGAGKMIFPETSSFIIYEGNWENNKMHGAGKLTCANGDVHTGYWVRGMRVGRGKITKPDGKQIYGSWMNGKFIVDEEDLCDTTDEDQ